MPHTPERPFVPRRTPTKAQPAVASADFAVSRPFVPGAERERIESFRADLDTERESGALPSIASFLDSTPRVPAIVPDRDDDAYADELDPDDRELPPIEHFTDPLPGVGEFASDATTADTADLPDSGTRTADAAQAEWVETDWLQYDWRAAAALGDSGENEASSAWADTDWEAGRPQANETTRPNAAQAIATALDQIAQKIRDGELALPNPGTVTDPRTIASTLAALLGIRQ